MTTITAENIDLDKPGKYPIVLSDSLLGKPSRDLYTGIRYNYKPPPTSNTSTSDLHLQPSTPTSYDLSFTENSEQYEYTGSRSINSGQCILLFDADKMHFVLHRLDSNFDMNLTSAPWTEDAAALRKQYPQLEATHNKSGTQRGLSKVKGAGVKKRVSVGGTGGRKAKPLPKEEEEEEEDESDDGLEIEYPGGPMQSQMQREAVFSTPRFEGAVSEKDSDDSSEEGGDSIYVHHGKGREREREQNQDVDLLQLPSPMNGHEDANGNGGLSEDDVEADLEAELEQALQAEMGSAESDESEEE